MDERNFNQTEQENQYSYIPEEPEKKDKKKGNTWAMVLAFAAIFGLVAGVAFKGIDIAYDTFASKKDDNKQVVQSVGTVEQVKTSDGTGMVAYDVSTMAENVMPSIVSITTKSIETIQTWFQRYEEEVEGSGSGIIIEQRDNMLYIMTNYHVVEGATSLTVAFNDSTVAQAAVKGYNAEADLAIVVVDMTTMSESTISSIKLAELGDSDAVKVGEPAIAIGNALGYGQSLTGGYISAVGRVLEGSPIGLIQTDAAINPGNSGGALLNAKGQVIGVNSSKLVDSRVEGMGFAIPMNEAMNLLQGIIDGTSGNIEFPETPDEDNPYFQIPGREDDGEFDIDEFFGDEYPDEYPDDDTDILENQTYLGIAGTTVTEEYAEYLGIPMGVYITQIIENSPAQKAGIVAGDVITEIDGQSITTIEALQSYIKSKQPGDTVTIFLMRRGNDGAYSSDTAEAVTVVLAAYAD